MAHTVPPRFVYLIIIFVHLAPEKNLQLRHFALEMLFDSSLRAAAVVFFI